MINLSNLTKVAINACYEAGQEILKVYQSEDFQVSDKSDNSPLTLADRLAHIKIASHLSQTHIPIVSEEGDEIPYSERKNWDYLWMVDPLDGTKEFIKRNDEFTVNIALIHKGKVVLGVVYAPVLKQLYYGNVEEGAFKIENGSEPVLLTINKNQEVKTIVASRSHLSTETQNFMNQYPHAEVISMGSSLKFMLVADGGAQLYPRFAPTMEWDTAAAQAIVEAAGGLVCNYPSGEPVVYNRENMLNGWFIVK
jgi:3'(2'), 5'-bisphosphate nucleotidase